jgi:hypothetical protein
MLRVNLMEDEGFRKDVLDMARGIMRSCAEQVIGETIRVERWLERRVEAYLEKNPVPQLVDKTLREGEWYKQPEFLRAIRRLKRRWITLRSCWNRSCVKSSQMS